MPQHLVADAEQAREVLRQMGFEPALFVPRGWRGEYWFDSTSRRAGYVEGGSRWYAGWWTPTAPESRAVEEAILSAQAAAARNTDRDEPQGQQFHLDLQRLDVGRAWLADRCCVSRSTVDRWCMGYPAPAAVVAWMQRRITDAPPKVGDEAPVGRRKAVGK